ncbi:hypothetical protein PR202_gb02118 [Eleusine coracana subsp. coracana]|uniref:Glutaredoxin domain-containing protein n=1 Tax=Eleusine coracana subsp. coracana TaxID=191504 RepID=A0AAV5DVY3_ELECO|nr:hypothetical protein QOZ80_5BG0411290 [Eleusine coracana subsp. coracana]GJN15224.1 hypothetical protein PR202_gb02118 [Eleusine coracana subsp. coracana]
MYQAIPYSASRAWSPRTHQPAPPPTMESAALVVEAAADEEEKRRRQQQQQGGGAGEEVRRAVAECPVLVVGRRGCCLSHVVKRLLQGLGVNPAVHEVAGGEADLAGLVDGRDVVPALPAVFVGGRLLGGLDRLMAVHISGDLVPILKDAGALWL